MSKILTIRKDADLLTLAQLFDTFKKTGKGGDRKVRAFKYTDKGGVPPVYSGSKIRYRVGEMVEVKSANKNEQNGCARGVNVASFEWCVNDGGNGYTRVHNWREVYLMEFTVKDIAAIPRRSWDNKPRGKFRLFRGTPIARMTNDGKKRIPVLKPLVLTVTSDLERLAKLVKAFKRTGKGGERIVHGYKYTEQGGRPPLHKATKPVLRYVPGKTVAVPRANTNANEDCGAGVNLGTREWILSDGGWGGHMLYRWHEGFLMEFTVADVAAIPRFNYGIREGRVRGKFRVFKAKTVKRLNASLTGDFDASLEY